MLLGEGVIVVGANLDRVRQSTLELVGSICPWINPLSWPKVLTVIYADLVFYNIVTFAAKVDILIL